MNDAAIMCKLQRFTKGRNNRQRLLRAKLPCAQEFPEIHAIHKLHEQIEEAATLSEIVNRHDVRVTQRRERLRFSREALAKVRILLSLGCEQFQRNHAVQ